jgi:hypothetical protein
MKQSQLKPQHEKWFVLVEEQEKSGLSQKVFCQQKNIILSQFVYYRLLYRNQKTSPKPVTAFAPVTVINNERPATVSEIKLSLPNGFHCVFQSSLDIAQLKRVIGVLLTC